MESATLLSKTYPDRTKYQCMLTKLREARVAQKLNNLHQIVRNEERLKAELQPYIPDAEQSKFDIMP